MVKGRIAHQTMCKAQGVVWVYAEYSELEWKKQERRIKAKKAAKKMRKINRGK